MAQGDDEPDKVVYDPRDEIPVFEDEPGEDTKEVFASEREVRALRAEVRELREVLATLADERRSELGRVVLGGRGFKLVVYVLPVDEAREPPPE